MGDRQGSIVDLVNEQGAVVNHFVYDSFGNRTGTTTADFRFGYTGRELDSETGLYYYRARYFDPALGRFISEDPIGFSAGDTNLYRYVGNNATNYTDPSGEFVQAAPAAIFGAIAGGLYTIANDLETGNFNLGTFGRVAEGAVVGAFVGAAFSVGIGAFAAGATTVFGTSVAGAVVETSFFAGFAVQSAYSAGGNFGQGRYLTGALDLVGAGLGAFQTAKGINRDIPGIIQKEYVQSNVAESANARDRSGFGDFSKRVDEINNLANRNKIISNIQESANARADSSFAGFSQQASQYVIPKSIIIRVGRGENGTASDIGDLSGISKANAGLLFKVLGAIYKSGKKYDTYIFPDKSRITIRHLDNRVTKEPAPIYGADGTNVVKGRKLGRDGELLKTLDESGGQIPNTHNTGEYLK